MTVNGATRKASVMVKCPAVAKTAVTKSQPRSSQPTGTQTTNAIGDRRTGTVDRQQENDDRRRDLVREDSLVTI